MRYEDIIVKVVANHLVAKGWDIISTCEGTAHGDDIAAVLGSNELRIEAKGEGSSKEHTSRYGLAFTRNQVKDHVANAFFRAAMMKQKYQCAVGIALPDNSDHIEMIERIRDALNKLEIEIYWVSESLTVRTDRCEQTGLLNSGKAPPPLH
ncbi:MAG: hypothetical protein O3C43_06480 [Verrucomicrobia bacterium]|nr:hypothetical protein [Verrucomicrobiota bacterium]MDA1066133.1 hypothetical protein [Verrucomicrobiota bacterium]